MRQARVDTRGVITVPGPTGQAFVTVDEAAGENSIIVVPGANAHLDPASVQAHRARLERSTVIVLQGELPPDTTAAAVSMGNARLILNVAPVIPLDKTVILRADPLEVNEHEARLSLKMLGRDVGELDTEEGVVEALLGEGIHAVVITLGADGAVFSEGGTVVRVPAPVMDAVDTTGAGDAFVGALSARIAVGAPMQDAVEFAVRVGAFAVGRHGAQPSYPEAEDQLPGGAQ